MKKVFAIVALVAAMFVAGNVQAQTTINLGYAPESFVSGNTSTNYQGFFAGFTQNFGLSKGFGLAAGAQFRMNTKSGDAFFGFGTGKSTQILVDVPILFNYAIALNRDLNWMWPFGLLNGGTETKQIWTGPEGTMTLKYLRGYRSEEHTSELQSR